METFRNSPSVDACTATIRVAETIAPKNQAIMDEAYKQYRKIYPALRSLNTPA